MTRPGRLIVLLGLTVALSLGGGEAHAAGPPHIAASWVTEVGATSGRLRAEVNPNGLTTTYRFHYLTEAVYQANLGATPPKDPFSGALKVPLASEAPIGSGETTVAVAQHVGALKPATTYHYRIVATNSASTTIGPAHILTTEENAPIFSLPDKRGWEMVSPVDKNGGQIQGFGGNFNGGVLQGAAAGSSVTYTSSASFAAAQGAPGASQYISRRTTSGWSTENVTTSLLSGSYGDDPDGVPYQLFSDDLARGLVSNGWRCRGIGEECPVANPPLAGSSAPAGYRNYYLRSSVSGSFEALLDQSDVAGIEPEDFEVSFAGSTPDLGHVVLSTCAALTVDAVAVPGPQGCDAAASNLYLWSGSELELVNLRPGEAQGTPGADLPAQSRAISANGSRVYWSHEDNLYLREGAETAQVDADAGGGGTFETASTDGSIAFFSKAGHLYRYDVSTESSTDLTPAGEVQGVLGASEDGSHVYYLTSGGLLLSHNGAVTVVASNAEPSSFPPTTGTARISPSGTHLAFLSKDALLDYDNNGQPEVYLYNASKATLICVSCNPTGERPLGPASIPGAPPNGTGSAATHVYKPRSLSASGNRLFFDSFDSLVPQDTNGDRDVYQWEAQGTGSCLKPIGCVNLISNGKSEDGASFVDASEDGSDVFFLTGGSLVQGDPGAVDIYDARVGGGFPIPPSPIPCVGDACQPIPGKPEDPRPGTYFSSASGNPPVSFPRSKSKKSQKKRHHKKRHGNKRKHRRGPR